MKFIRQLQVYLFRYWKLSFFFVALITWYVFCLPDKLFDDPYATVVRSRDGQMLSATIAIDGQWRFPPSDSVNERYRDAVVLFEDKRFFSHPGVDVLSLGRAIRQNVSARKVVSGGSTLTMQVVRLARKGRSRSILEKVKEFVLASRLEWRYDKNKIVTLYASHAPFGGNVVGIKAACWRYFGRDDKELSWGEAALLAVLPNSPALIHPGRNRDALFRKRNRLLDKLHYAGKIDSLTCELSKAEPLPGEPIPLPQHARHLLSYLSANGNAQRETISTIDYGLQLKAEEILKRHHLRLEGNQIHNGAAIIAEVESGNVVAYIGNVAERSAEAKDVDIIQAPRSTGSILKPLLFAASLDDGKILPRMLVPDVPTYINGFVPRNFSRQYDGAVPADKALIRSLNIPAVYLLKDYRYERFHTLLQRAGMSTLKKGSDHYGLSLILGGAEGSLWDIAGMYASMARTLNRSFTYAGKGRYRKSDIHPLTTVPVRRGSSEPVETSLISAAAIYETFEALQELYRPGEETGWRYFTSSQRIAWKTGTSFGFRDGWAVGVTPTHVVAVWVGNADGEGRPGLTGTDAAAPIMFELFSHLAPGQWFRKPVFEMQPVAICSKSGFRYSTACERADTIWVGKSSLETPACPYHRKVHLTMDRKYQVNSLCSSIQERIEENRFVLPPVQEYYYRTRHAAYRPLPPVKPGCGTEPASAMDFIYPRRDTRVFIPRDLSGREGEVVLHLAHRDPTASVFWHLDGEYIGTTRSSHLLAVRPEVGHHKVLVMDQSGAVLEHEFDVLPKL